jgi:hypothetical protein
MSLSIYSPSSRFQVGPFEGLFGVEVPFFGGMLAKYHFKLDFEVVLLDNLPFIVYPKFWPFWVWIFLFL